MKLYKNILLLCLICFGSTKLLAQYGMVTDASPGSHKMVGDRLTTYCKYSKSHVRVEGDPECHACTTEAAGNQAVGNKGNGNGGNSSNGNGNGGNSANGNGNGNSGSNNGSGGTYEKTIKPGQPFQSQGNDGSYLVLQDMKDRPYKYIFAPSLGRWVLKPEYTKNNPLYRGEEPPEYYKNLDKQTKSGNGTHVPVNVDAPKTKGGVNGNSNDNTNNGNDDYPARDFPASSFNPKTQPFESNDFQVYHVSGDMQKNPSHYQYNENLNRWMLKSEYDKYSSDYKGGSANKGGCGHSSTISSGGFFVPKLEPGQPFQSNGNDGQFYVLNDMNEKPYKFQYNDGLGRWVLKDEYIPNSKRYRGEDPQECYDQKNSESGQVNNGMDENKLNVPKPGKYDNVKILNENNNFDIGDHETTGSVVGDYLQDTKNDFQNQMFNNSVNNIAKDFNSDMKGSGLQQTIGQLNDWAQPVDIINDSGKDLIGKIGFGALTSGVSAYVAAKQQQDAVMEKAEKIARMNDEIKKAKKDFYSKQSEKIQTLIYASLNKNEESYYKQCYANNKECYDRVTTKSADCNPTSGLISPAHEVLIDDLKNTYSLFATKLVTYNENRAKKGSDKLRQTNAAAILAKSREYKSGTTNENSLTQTDIEFLDRSLIEIILQTRKKYPNQQIGFFMGYAYYLAKDANFLAAYKELTNALSNMKSNFNADLNPNLESTQKDIAIKELESKMIMVKNEIVNDIKTDINTDNAKSISSLKAQGLLKSFNSNDELSKYALTTNSSECLKILTSNYSDTWPSFADDLIDLSVKNNQIKALTQFYTFNSANKNKINNETQSGKQLVSRGLKEKKLAILFFCEKYQGVDLDQEFERNLHSDKQAAILIARHFLNSLFGSQNEKAYSRYSNASVKLFGDKRLLKTYKFDDGANILKAASVGNSKFILSKLSNEFSNEEMKSESDFFNSVLSSLVVPKMSGAVNSFYEYFKDKPKVVNKETLELSYKSDFSGHTQLMKLADPSLLIVDLHKDSYLHKCALDGKSELAKQLLENKTVDVNYKNDFSNSALILACQKEDISMVKLLLDNGADPNAKCQAGFTPLMVAVKKQNQELARVLIAKHSDPALKNDNNLDCFDLIESTKKYKDSKQMLKTLKPKK